VRLWLPASRRRRFRASAASRGGRGERPSGLAQRSPFPALPVPVRVF